MQAAGITDTGRVRDENQDTFAIREDLGLALLADGVARPRAGGVAAEVAVDTALEYLVDARSREWLTAAHLRRALELANTRVYGLSQAVSAYRGMATTLVAAALVGSKGFVAHVGDSRAYRYRYGTLSAVTKDHSTAQEWVDAGLITAEEARVVSSRHVVTRAIGAELTLEPEVCELDLDPGDLLLMCSDGLTEHLEDEEIEEVLAATPGLGEAAECLVEAANHAGGSDNVTVVLVRC